MKNFALFLSLFLMTGYTRINDSSSENTQKIDFEDLVLIPDYELYNIRIDIIRQTEINPSTNETKNKPYYPIGFYLGNGIFVDLNDNVSFLVPKLLHIKNSENFTLEQRFHGNIFNPTTIYKKQDSLFSIKNKGLINIVTKNKITKKDSAIIVKSTLLSKYTIIKSKNSLSYHSGWDKNIIKKNKEGYEYKALFGKIKSQKKGNEIEVNNRYIFKNNGDTLEIYNIGLGKLKILSVRIIKSKNKLLVLSKWHKKLEITVTENEITSQKGKRIWSNYSVL